MSPFAERLLRPLNATRPDNESACRQETHLLLDGTHPPPLPLDILKVSFVCSRFHLGVLKESR